MAEEGEYIYGPWNSTGQREVEVRSVPTVVNGFGRAIETVPLVVERHELRRPVWIFLGYETKWEEI